MKKRLGILILSAGLLVTGCTGKGVELTTAENNMIAEYIATILLRHDRSYEDELIYATEPVEETQAIVEETIPTTAVTEATVATTETTEVAEPEIEYASLSEVFGNKFLEVSYNTREFRDSYPKGEKDYFLLQASEGKKLLVVQFRIKNTSDKKQSVHFADKGITYQLQGPNGEVIKPLLTALNNDIQYLHKTIEGNKTKEAVLIFEADPSINLGEQKLFVQCGDTIGCVEFK